MGGPTPSVPPSVGSLQEQLRPHSTPFCTVDHPQTADPVLAFGKMTGDTSSTTEATAHRIHLVVQAHFANTQPISQLMIKHIRFVRVGEHVLVEYVFIVNHLWQSPTDLRKYKCIIHSPEPVHLC